MRFKNRTEAGEKLASLLSNYPFKTGVVCALPRGGVPIGVEIARKLNIPLDLIIPRKIGHPQNPEYAVCAVGERGELVCNERVAAQLDPHWLRQAVKRELAEARRRRAYYLGDRKPLPAEGKTIIVTDDGIATGLTMRAAIQDARQRSPARVVVAVPVVPKDTAELLRREADELVALDIPELFRGAVGAYYDEFLQVSDEEVVDSLFSLKP